ncbi:MAG TPA: type III-A CRISPR-associated protein Csm2 [Candidatus Brocadiia bacterium]|nr:type III-A CRISPR-associated protein Csm2 [Candidatus Brocadiales bacterium]
MEVKFYSDQKKEVLNAELFSSHAEEWAKSVCESGLKEKKDKKTGKVKKVLEKNKSSQIRKFYNEVLKYTKDLKSGEDYKLILPYMKMLNAKTAYAEGRKLITDEFKSFIKLSIGHLTEDKPETLELFASFFEAFMGYYKYYESQYKGSEEEKDNETDRN